MTTDEPAVRSVERAALEGGGDTPLLPLSLPPPPPPPPPLPLHHAPTTRALPELTPPHERLAFRVSEPRAAVLVQKKRARGGRSLSTE
ncbi:hypothetical protein AOLI_G00010650 [Acnodon oligacanthus]